MAGKFLCPRCFEEQSLDSIQYICSNESKPCQLAIDKKPQRAENSKKPVCTECKQARITKI